MEHEATTASIKKSPCEKVTARALFQSVATAINGILSSSNDFAQIIFKNDCKPVVLKPAVGLVNSINCLNSLPLKSSAISSGV